MEKILFQENVQLKAKSERERERMGHNFMEKYSSSPSLIIMNAKSTFLKSQSKTK
jgi:hypothetical protein